MGRNSTKTSQDVQKKSPPSRTPESQENKMIALAMKRAEEQLENGTASSQIICHFLKLGTTTAELEKQKLVNENTLLEAKAKALEEAQNSEKLFAEAIAAFRSYGGGGNDDGNQNL